MVHREDYKEQQSSQGVHNSDGKKARESGGGLLNSDHKIHISSSMESGSIANIIKQVDLLDEEMEPENDRNSMYELTQQYQKPYASVGGLSKVQMQLHQTQEVKSPNSEFSLLDQQQNSQKPKNNSKFMFQLRKGSEPLVPNVVRLSNGMQLKEQLARINEEKHFEDKYHDNSPNPNINTQSDKNSE